MAFRSILGNKGRSVLTMLGIIIGIASVMTIVSTINGMNQQSLKQFEAMGTNKISVSAQRYDGQDVFQDLYDYCLQLSDYVEGVTPNSNIWGVNVIYGTKSSKAMEKNQENMGSSDGMSTEMAELPPELYLGSDQYAVCNNFQIERGRDLSFLDIQKYNQVCVLGARAARNFFGYADPVGQSMTVNGYPFTVIGVYQEKDPDSQWSQDNIIVFPYTQSRILSPGQSFSEFSVKARSAEAAVEATSRISGYLSGLMGQNQEKGYFWVDSNNRWQSSYNEQATMMSVVLGGIAAISLLVGGIGIMNIMLVSVTERTREIGIRKSLGAKRRDIRRQFIIEAGTTSALGGLVGILFGYLMAVAVGSLFGGMLVESLGAASGVTFNATPTLGAILVSFGVSVGIGMLFGYLPANKAAKLNPIDALRYE